MISITCTNCKTVLNIDDAFAGGVCRCQHCGTIQTVPKRLRESAPGESSSAAAQAAGKALYQNRKAAIAEAAGPSGTGLDDLANVVASSGLSSGRLQKTTARGEQETAPRTGDHKTLLIVSLAGAIIVVLLGVIIFMAVRDKTQTPVQVVTPVPKPEKQPDNHLEWRGQQNIKPAKPPQFLGHRITESSVVYILDRGQISVVEGKLDPLKSAVIRSLETLGPQRKFQVIFWSLDNKVWAYPENGLAPAETKRIEECRKKMEDVFGSGQPKLQPALDKALKSNPDAIMLVPIKSFLDEGFHPMVMKTRGTSKVKIYTFSIDQPDIGPILKKVSTDTGATYYGLKMYDLRAATQ